MGRVGEEKWKKGFGRAYNGDPTHLLLSAVILATSTVFSYCSCAQA